MNQTRSQRTTTETDQFGLLGILGKFVRFSKSRRLRNLRYRFSVQGGARVPSSPPSMPDRRLNRPPVVSVLAEQPLLLSVSTTKSPS
jgi:hypothetical protein